MIDFGTPLHITKIDSSLGESLDSAVLRPPRLRTKVSTGNNFNRFSANFTRFWLVPFAYRGLSIHSGLTAYETFIIRAVYFYIGFSLLLKVYLSAFYSLHQGLLCLGFLSSLALQKSQRLYLCRLDIVLLDWGCRQ